MMGYFKILSGEGLSCMILNILLKQITIPGFRPLIRPVTVNQLQIINVRNNFRLLTSMTAPCFSKTTSHNANEPNQQQKTKETFDDFRAREEQKEKKFEAQYAAESDKSSEQQKINAEDEKLASVQTRILEAAMQHVGTLGWSKQALSQGAEAVGYQGIAHGMFPRGGAELIDYFNAQCNKKLIEFMEDLVASHSSEKEKPEPPPKFVFKAIQHRLQLVAPFKSQWAQALAVMTMPPNVPTALSNLLTMVDDVCYYAGDRSVDVSLVLKFNFFQPIYQGSYCDLFVHQITKKFFLLELP